ncbi:MAG: nickel pincer cofactor biosynthesis protein LarC [Candidatus Acidiferrales bacterium]
MKIAYFDCFSGISGDMVLGALVDSGVEIAALEAELRRLDLHDWKISAAKVKRGALFASQVTVESREDHHHRGLSEIMRMIERAELPPRVKDRASRIFQRLGEAEAKVHQVDIEKVHFHEVGAVDAIIDIVGAAVGFELLGIDEFACSSLDVGAGRVKTAHGILPVPAPATAELLRDAPVYSSGIEKELVTPTGAAIASTLATRFAEIPPMHLKSIGYGAGSTDLAERPNVFRLLVGDAAGMKEGEQWDAPISVIEANLDDMSPQIYGYFVERALAAGALDVFSSAVQMKKNRPGLLVTLLCEDAAVNSLVDVLFQETTTIGVRTYEVRRRTLKREVVPVETPFGAVRMKVSRQNGTMLNAAPEYEDCRKIAAEKGIPLKQVIATANFHYQKLRETQK